MRILALVKTKTVTDQNGKSFYIPYRSEIIWILNSIKSEYNHDIWVYDISEQVLFNLNSKKYFRVFKTAWIPKIFRNLLSLITLMIQYRGKFQLLHIFYLRMEFQLLSPLLLKLTPNNYITIYGTDYYGHRLPVLFNYCLKKCNKYTTTYVGLNERIIQKYGSRLLKKNTIIPLPIMYFEAIKFYNPDKAASKFTLGIPESKKVVVCGTRAGFEEQYDKILKELAKVTTNDIQYIFTITYGDSKKNIDALEKQIRGTLGNNAMIFKEFMPIEKIITIRTACDIFINLRKHDQFAGSMIESFHAMSHIITGNWLKYHGLKEEGFFYTTIDKINELPDCLSAIAGNHDRNSEISDNLRNNKRLILHKYQNETTRMKWINLYKA